MPYCREGHTLQDDESEDFRTLVPGVFFEIDIDGGTFFGIVDEYTDPEEFSFLCRLYTDAGRTILLTTPLTLAVPYDIRDFVGWSWEARDVEQDVNSKIGTYVSNEVTIRDDIGVWVGEWIGEPKSDDTIQYNFRGTHTRFKAPVFEPQIVEIGGAGLGAADYSYCIVALDGSGRLGAGSRTLEITLAGSADIFLAWAENNQVASWNVYGRINGTIGLLANVLTNSYTDDGTDTPNTSFKPPLFEDSAWTPVEATLDVTGTEGAATFATTGDFDSVAEKQDDGLTISTFTAAGITAYDDGVTGDFDLDNLVSTTGVMEDVVVDNIFEGQPAPAIGTIVELNYVQHVFIDEAGNKVIYTRDDNTGQEIEITVFADDGTYGIVLTNESGIFLDTAPIAGEVLPEVGSVNVNVKYEVTEITAEGRILAKETHIVNSYNAIPIAGAGIKQVLVAKAGGAPSDFYVRESTDKLATFDVDRRFDTDLTFLSTPGLHFIKNMGNISVLEDWKVLLSSSGTDFSFHWSNAPNWDNWFEDIVERVVSSDVQAEFEADSGNKEMVTWTFPSGYSGFGPISGHKMVRCANGALFVYNTTNILSSRKTFSTFFPETGDFSSFIFPDPKVSQVIVWPEKNKLFATASQSIADPPLERGKVYSYDISNNPTNPISNEQLVYTYVDAPLTNHLYFGCSNDRIWAVSQDSTFNMNAAHATQPDFSDVAVAQFNPVLADPESNNLGLLPNSRFQYTPDLGYVANWRDAGGTIQRTYQSVDGLSWSTLDHALGFYNEQTLAGRNGAGSNWLGSPWDGTTRYTPNGGTNDTFTGFRKQNVNLVDQGVVVLPLPPVPSQPGPVVWDKTTTLLQPINLGAPRLARDIINVEMRSSFGGSAFIPLDVASPPAPRQIADVNKAYVYSTRNTKTYNTEFRTSKQIAEAISRGGVSNPISDFINGVFSLTTTLVGDSDVAAEAFERESIPIGF